jgi:ankyrin repeat protein
MLKFFIRFFKNQINIPNDFNFYPIHTACIKNNYKILKLLIKNGASINLINNKLDTPLHIACKKKNFSIIKLLIDNGADIYLKNNKGNKKII